MPAPSSGSGSEDRRDRIVGLLREGEPTPIAEVTPTEGPAAVEGSVVAHAGTVEGPMTDEAAVLVEYERGRNEDGRYEPVEGRIQAVPFLVEDDTGRVLVDPTGYGYDDGPLPISPGKTRRFEGDEPGENVRPVEEDPVLPWIHAEAAIRPGDEVYVVGDPAPAEDQDLPGDVGVRIGPGEPGGEFLLTDLSRPALAEELRIQSRLPRRFWQYLVLGLIVVAILVGAFALLVINFG